MIVKIQVRRGLSTQWTSVNPILSSGEFGYETDTGKLKIGNGSTAWVDREYLQAEGLELTSPITGYSIGPNLPLEDDDSILDAFGKLQGQVTERVSGSGTLNYLPKFSDASNLSNSRIIDNGNSCYINNQSTNTFWGLSSGLNSDLASRNQTSFGYEAAKSNTTGTGWTAFGSQAGLNNTIGSGWSAIGRNAGLANTTGSNWLAFGVNSGFSNTTGNNWIAIGLNSGQANISGFGWVSFGINSALRNTNGNDWISIGRDSARRYFDGSDTANFSQGIYIGYDTRVGAIDATNEIVIGYGSVGGGSNTVVIGNGSTISNRLFGTLRVGSITNATGNFATYSATGVLQQRTAVQSADDILKAISGYSAGVNQILEHNSSGLLNWVNT